MSGPPDPRDPLAYAAWKRRGKPATDGDLAREAGEGDPARRDGGRAPQPPPSHPGPEPKRFKQKPKGAAVVRLPAGRGVRPPLPPAPPYAELATQSCFSFLRAASFPEELVEAAQALGLQAVAVADRNTLSGIVRAHVKAKELGMRLVPGVRLAFSDGSPDILAYPENRNGYGRLTRLLSVGNQKAHVVKGECDLKLEDLLAHAEDLLLALVAPERPDRGLASLLERLKAQAPGKVWLAVQMRRGPADGRRLKILKGLSEEAGVPLLAIGDALYHTPDRRPLQDVMTCIREHVTLAEAGRRLEANAERAIKSAAEIALLFRQVPDAVAETVRLVERARFSLDEIVYEYPDDDLPEGVTPQDELVRRVEVNLPWRYPNGVPDKVRVVVKHELALIAELDYAKYFLTVQNVVNAARERHILCQGRGSAANSAVCYVLGITEVDPAVHALLFERFISANRNEPPDIDVDFEHERREEVIQWIYERYGRERASIAATVITYRARSAIREVGKVFGLSDDAVGALTSTVWGWSNEPTAAEGAARVGLDPEDETLKLVLKLAREIIGFPRHLSQHVGGFVITRGRLDEIVPVGKGAMADRTFIEWDKDDLDAMGLLKIDVLALGMLTCIRKAFDMLERDYGERLTLATTPAEEPEVYEMIGRADTIGVFQIESRAQQSMLPRLRPKCLYDLVIEVAIVRPGPIQGDMVHPYLRRREGREPVTYPSPELEEVLGKTLGVPLFQEQAMRIAMVAAGFSAAEADQLRRAMATFRNVGTIHSFRQRFVAGMIERGYDPEFSANCFKQIEGFGGYGFPESHAASFASLAYVSSWLKCRWPDVFAAALLNSQPMGFYAPAQIVRDAEEHGIEARPVDVGFSDWDCTLETVDTVDAAGVEKVEGGSGQGRQRVRPGHEEERALRPFVHPEASGSLSSAHPREGGDPYTSPDSSEFGGSMDPSLRGDERERGDERRRGDQRGRARLHPRHVSMAGVIRSTQALRLGLRQVKGLAETDGRAVAAARARGCRTMEELWRVSGVGVGALERLAEADAFRSMGLNRRQALWEARALSGRFHAPTDPQTEAVLEVREPEIVLPPQTLGEAVVDDYRRTSLSLKAHPVSFLREDLKARGAVPAERLAEMKPDAWVKVAGLVLVRQMPGSAGVVFVTLEDETAHANIIVWPKMYEKFRPQVIGSRLLQVTGRLQIEREVVHVIAYRIEDLSWMLSGLSERGGEVSALANADEVKRPQLPRSRDRPYPGTPQPVRSRHPRDQQIGLFDAAAEAMPKGRNFH